MTAYRPVLAGLLVLLAACSGNDAASTATDRIDAPPADINARFKDPEADPERWLDRFEIESREIFSERAEIVAVVGLESGERVADVGAGTGLFVGPFAEAVGKDGKVYAVDISPSLVEHMRSRFESADFGHVEVVLSEEKSTLLPASSVDVVFTCDTYHHFTYYQDMLASIHDALDVGGRLIVIDFEREPGKSPDWILGHVRAGKAQVIEEIESAGFELDEEIEISGLVENYALRFVKR